MKARRKFLFWGLFLIFGIFYLVWANTPRPAHKTEVQSKHSSTQLPGRGYTAPRPLSGLQGHFLIAC